MTGGTGKHEVHDNKDMILHLCTGANKGTEHHEEGAQRADTQVKTYREQEIKSALLTCKLPFEIFSFSSLLL